jgi:hypothetical protein
MKWVLRVFVRKFLIEDKSKKCIVIKGLKFKEIKRVNLCWKLVEVI